MCPKHVDVRPGGRKKNTRNKGNSGGNRPKNNSDKNVQNAIKLSKALSIFKDVPRIKEIAGAVGTGWEKAKKFDKRTSSMFDKAFATSDKIHSFAKRTGLAATPAGSKMSNAYKFGKRLRNQTKRAKNGFVRDVDQLMDPWR